MINKVQLPEPSESDYPGEMFRGDLPPALRVGCGWAYFRTLPFVRRIFRRRVEAVLQLVPQRPLRRALDAGTGIGFLLPVLAALAEEVVGADLSPVLNYAKTMLDRRGLSNVRLLTADLQGLPFVDGAFDIVICLSVIEHIPDPMLAFSEMARVLRKGGTVIVGYPLEHVLFRLLESLLAAHWRWQIGRPTGEPFRPHVSDTSSIESGWNGLFRLDALSNIRVAGIPSYRVVRLARNA